MAVKCDLTLMEEHIQGVVEEGTEEDILIKKSLR
jgi:hypothetical protein